MGLGRACKGSRGFREGSLEPEGGVPGAMGVRGGSTFGAAGGCRMVRERDLRRDFGESLEEEFEVGWGLVLGLGKSLFAIFLALFHS